MMEISSHLEVLELTDQRDMNGLADALSILVPSVRLRHRQSIDQEAPNILHEGWGITVDQNLLISAARTILYDAAVSRNGAVELDELANEESGLFLLRQYSVLASVHTGALETVDLPAIIEMHPLIDRDGEKRAVHVDELDGYSLKPLRTMNGSRVGEAEAKFDEDRVWIDTPSGVCLTNNDARLRLTSFRLDKQGRFFVPQLQGVPGSESLIPMLWTRVLVDANESIATANGVTDVVIQSAENNIFAQSPDYGLAMQRAEVLYDRTAEAMGYTMQEDGNWHKSLTV